MVLLVDKHDIIPSKANFAEFYGNAVHDREGKQLQTTWREIPILGTRQVKHVFTTFLKLKIVM